MADYDENTAQMHAIPTERAVPTAEAERILAFLLEDAEDVPAPTRLDVERAVDSPDPALRAATLKALLVSRGPMDYRGDALYRIGEPLFRALSFALRADQDELADRILGRVRPSDFSRLAPEIIGAPKALHDELGSILRDGWRFLGAAEMSAAAALRTTLETSLPAPSLRLVPGTWYLFGRPNYFEDRCFSDLRAVAEESLDAVRSEAFEKPVLRLTLAADELFVTSRNSGTGELVRTRDYIVAPPPATASERSGFRLEDLDRNSPPEVSVGSSKRRWIGTPSFDWFRVRTGW